MPAMTDEGGRSAVTVLRAWFEALGRAQVEPDQEAADDLHLATEAMLDFCRQEFGEAEQEATDETEDES